jgi:acyl-coenzyme A synthetase/AMP-(fatty) acid ligase
MSLPAIYSVIHSPVMAQVRELRFTQERAGEIELQIVPVSKEPSSRLERELLSEIYNRIDEHDLAVRIRFLENLPRKRAGKAGLLEQKLQVTFEDIAS